MKNSEALITLEEVKYPVSIDEITSFIAEWKEIPSLDATAGVKDENFLSLKSAHLKAVRFRTTIDKRRKQLVAPALEYQREVNSIAKEYTALLANTETELFSEINKVESFEAREKQKLLDAEKSRIETLGKKLIDLKDIPSNFIGANVADLEKALSDLTEPTLGEYEEKIEVAKFLYIETKEKLEYMLEQSIKGKLADKRAKEEEAEAKKVADEIEAKQRADREALDAERAEFEAEKKALAEAQALKQAEDDAEAFEKEQEEARRKKEDDKKQLKSTALHVIDAVVQTAVDTESYVAEDILEAIIEGEIPGVSWLL